MPVLWWIGLNLVLLVGRAMTCGVFWGVCELSMTLGSLSSKGWGCIPVLLVVWHGATSTGACCHWVELCLSTESEISGRTLADWYYVELGRLWWSSVLNSALPPQRLRPDIRPEHQDTVSHIAQ